MAPLNRRIQRIDSLLIFPISFTSFHLISNRLKSISYSDLCTQYRYKCASAWLFKPRALYSHSQSGHRLRIVQLRSDRAPVREVCRDNSYPSAGQLAPHLSQCPVLFDANRICVLCSRRDDVLLKRAIFTFLFTLTTFWMCSVLSCVLRPLLQFVFTSVVFCRNGMVDHCICDQ